jgi:hypothetical protein
MSCLTFDCDVSYLTVKYAFHEWLTVDCEIVTVRLGFLR